MKFRIVDRDESFSGKQKKSIEDVRESVASKEKNIRVIYRDDRRYVTLYRNDIKVASIEITENEELGKEQIRQGIKQELLIGTFDKYIFDEYRRINRERARERVKKKRNQ